MSRFLAKLRERRLVPVWQLLLLTVCLTVTWSIGIFGVAQYLAERDEASCQSRRELAEFVGISFTTVFDAIDETNAEPSPALAAAREDLAELYRNLELC